MCAKAKRERVRVNQLCSNCLRTMAEFMTGPSDVLSDILKNIRQKQFEKHVIKKLADYPWTYYAKRISNKSKILFSR